MRALTLAPFSLVLLAVWVALPFSLRAQESRASLPGYVLGGIARTARGDGLGTGFALQLMLGRRLGKSTVLGVDLAYLRLGSRVDRGATITLPPEAAPATFVSSASQHLYLIGLALDQRLCKAPVSPSVLVGFGYYGVAASSHFTVRDTTGQVDRESHDAGTFWGPGLSLGLGLYLPSIGHGLTPRIQLRGHVMVVKTTESWSEYDAFSAGLGLAW